MLKILFIISILFMWITYGKKILKIKNNEEYRISIQNKNYSSIIVMLHTKKCGWSKFMKVF